MKERVTSISATIPVVWLNLLDVRISSDDRQSIVKVDNSSDVSAHTNLEVRQHFVEQHKELPKELQGVEAA